MERAIIHSNIKKEDLQPRQLLKKYKDLLKEEIPIYFPKNELTGFMCPVKPDDHFIESFLALKMNYSITNTYQNIFLNPRPKSDSLDSFYKNSKARQFWFSELWPKTQNIRNEKIISKYIEWIKRFIDQFFFDRENLIISEFSPNHWGFLELFKDIYPKIEYEMIQPNFNKELCEVFSSVKYGEYDESLKDIILMFEAIDRSIDPLSLFKKASSKLKPGGLCFITTHLSSGFEIKILKENSEVFIPPEKMNIFSYEGIIKLIDIDGSFEILEFSTPGVLDVSNVKEKLNKSHDFSFIDYILKVRQGDNFDKSLLEFIQMNRLGTFGRLVLRKK